MTRLSESFIPTLKEAPADAEAVSHESMVRAGLIRRVGAGLWSYLPAEWRVLRKVEAWEKTGRYGIDELFKLEDRKGAPMVLAMTHEECVTQHVAKGVRSCRDLPLMLFQLQTKERDEPRPRAGILRTREFAMKGAYSFDRDEQGLARSYELQAGAYERIFDRCGLRWHRVESDVGTMGGSGAHEYMAPCAAGENEIALAPGYAANVEVATAAAQPVELPAPLEAPQRVATPEQTTVEEVSGALGVTAGALLKALPVWVEGRGMVLVLVRGDHRLNEVKLCDALGGEVRQAVPEEIEAGLGPVGFLGPVGASIPVVKDAAIAGDSFVCGANEERVAADDLYDGLRAAGIEVLYDERDAGAGEKLTEAELLGCPLRLVVGRRGLGEGVVEASERASGAEHKLPVGEAVARAQALLWGDG